MGVLFSFMAALLASSGSGQADEKVIVPGFHRVVMVNQTGKQIGLPAKLHRLPVICERLDAEGRWHEIARLEAPVGSVEEAVMSPGEVWQLVVPDFGGREPAKIRLTLKGASGSVHSEPFDAVVESRSVAGARTSCYLVRQRIQPPEDSRGFIAALEQKSGP